MEYSFKYSNNQLDRRLEFPFKYKANTYDKEYDFKYNRDGIQISIDLLKDLVAISKTATRSFNLNLIKMLKVSKDTIRFLDDKTLKIASKNTIYIVPINNFVYKKQKNLKQLQKAFTSRKIHQRDAHVFDVFLVSDKNKNMSVFETNLAKRKIFIGFYYKSSLYKRENKYLNRYYNINITRKTFLGYVNINQTAAKTDNNLNYYSTILAKNGIGRCMPFWWKDFLLSQDNKNITRIEKELIAKADVLSLLEQKDLKSLSTDSNFIVNYQRRRELLYKKITGGQLNYFNKTIITDNYKNFKLNIFNKTDIGSLDGKESLSNEQIYINKHADHFNMSYPYFMDFGNKNILRQGYYDDEITPHVSNVYYAQGAKFFIDSFETYNEKGYQNNNIIDIYKIPDDKLRDYNYISNVFFSRKNNLKGFKNDKIDKGTKWGKTFSNYNDPLNLDKYWHKLYAKDYIYYGYKNSHILRYILDNIFISNSNKSIKEANNIDKFTTKRRNTNIINSQYFIEKINKNVKYANILDYFYINNRNVKVFSENLERITNKQRNVALIYKYLPVGRIYYKFLLNNKNVTFKRIYKDVNTIKKETSWIKKVYRPIYIKDSDVFITVKNRITTESSHDSAIIKARNTKFIENFDLLFIYKTKADIFSPKNDTIKKYAAPFVFSNNIVNILKKKKDILNSATNGLYEFATNDKKPIYNNINKLFFVIKNKNKVHRFNFNTSGPKNKKDIYRNNEDIFIFHEKRKILRDISTNQVKFYPIISERYETLKDIVFIRKDSKRLFKLEKDELIKKNKKDVSILNKIVNISKPGKPILLLKENNFINKIKFNINIIDTTFFIYKKNRDIKVLNIDWFYRKQYNTDADDNEYFVYRKNRSIRENEWLRIHRRAYNTYTYNMLNIQRKQIISDENHMLPIIKYPYNTVYDTDILFLNFQNTKNKSVNTPSNSGFFIYKKIRKIMKNQDIFVPKNIRQAYDTKLINIHYMQRKIRDVADTTFLPIARMIYHVNKTKMQNINKIINRSSENKIISIYQDKKKIFENNEVFISKITNKTFESILNSPIKKERPKGFYTNIINANKPLKKSALFSMMPIKSLAKNVTLTSYNSLLSTNKTDKYVLLNANIVFNTDKKSVYLEFGDHNIPISKDIYKAFENKLLNISKDTINLSKYKGEISSFFIFKDIYKLYRQNIEFASKDKYSLYRNLNFERIHKDNYEAFENSGFTRIHREIYKSYADFNFSVIHRKIYKMRTANDLMSFTRSYDLRKFTDAFFINKEHKNLVIENTFTNIYREQGLRNSNSGVLKDTFTAFDKAIKAIFLNVEDYSFLSFNKNANRAFSMELLRILKSGKSFQMHNESVVTKSKIKAFYDGELLIDKFAKDKNIIDYFQTVAIKERIRAFYTDCQSFIKNGKNLWIEEIERFQKDGKKANETSISPFIKNRKELYIFNFETVNKGSKYAFDKNIVFFIKGHHKAQERNIERFIKNFKIPYLDQNVPALKSIKDVMEVDVKGYNISKIAKDTKVYENQERALAIRNILVHVLKDESAARINNASVIDTYMLKKDFFTDTFENIEDLVKIAKEGQVISNNLSDWAWTYEDEEEFNDPYGIDELLLPEYDVKYEAFEDIIFNRNTGRPRSPVKEIDKYTFVAKFPNHYPIKEKDGTNAYEQIAVQYLDVKTSIMRQVFLAYFSIWQDNIFEFGRMTIPQSAKTMLDKLYGWIISGYFPEEDIPHALRTFRLIRWYLERAIIEDSEYIITYEPDDLTSGLLNTTEMDIPSSLHENNTMYIDTNLHIIKNNPEAEENPYLNLYIDNEQNTTISFSLYSTSPVYILLNDEVIDEKSVAMYKNLSYNIPYNEDGNTFTIKTIKRSGLDFFIGNIKVDGMGKTGELTIDFNPKIQGNKPLNNVSKKLLSYINLYEDNLELLQSLVKGNAHLDDVYEALKKYWDLHHEYKIKGKRLTIKKS